MNRSRKKKIDDIIAYLEEIAVHTDKNSDSIAGNISFFQSTYTFISFIKWLSIEAPRKDPGKLLELMDIDEKSPYAKDLLSSLRETERKIFPGLVNPLVRRICKLISNENNPLIINLGSGAMEVERQVIARLIRSGNKKPVVFVGVDKSPVAHPFAIQNLKTLGYEIELIENPYLDDDSLLDILSVRKSLYTIILCQNDIFSLSEAFRAVKFSLAFHCFFKHHFSRDQYIAIEDSIKKISDMIIEYDGFNNRFNTFTQALFAWRDPVLLNGAVFSNLRYLKKAALKNNPGISKIRTFWRRGTYLKEICYDSDLQC